MDIQEILRQAALIISDELEGNYRLFLFGSRAKGTGSDKSDIDIGVISNTRITGRQLLKIQEKLEQIPTLLKIDIVDFNSVDDEFKKIALKYTKDIEV
ncbi:DNA polymerase beta domain protein region [Desulfosarcina cetonica]|uniref:nucleotidyltransferase family protein n=1 Tax=Desulfosarcina cetonica TaxID=90730 RepID=UPI0006D2783E|nr:nucleotidyltransferase domain-containing protein [Desulfosarcina cetonica]VTR64131.1 DNA polymerase beta domain protein region [Desulfosarcina cetonica]